MWKEYSIICTAYTNQTCCSVQQDELEHYHQDEDEMSIQSLKITLLQLGHKIKSTRDPTPNTKKKNRKKSHRSKVSSGNSTSYFEHFHFNLPQLVGLFHLSMMKLSKINPQSYERGDFHDDDVKLLSPYTVAAITAMRKTTRMIAKRMVSPFFLLYLPRRYQAYMCMKMNFV